MKKLFAVLLAALMLTGCSEKSGFSGAGNVDFFGGSSARKSTKERLTDEDMNAYQFFARSIGGEPVEITDSEIINELWVYLSESEAGKPLRFQSGCETLGGVAGSTADELILRDKATGAEYSIAAGYPFNCIDAKDDEPAIRISGYRNENDLLWAAYKDVHGNFEALLDGLAERAGGTAKPSALLTDSPFEDYEFTGEAEVYDQETYTYTKYSGAVSEEAAKELWALLCDIERGEDIPRDDEYAVACVQHTSLTAWNLRTGKSYFIHNDLLCDSPEVDGGVPVITINGRVVAGLVNKLERLIFEGVAREENVVERKTSVPSQTWADKPEKLSDMSFEELKFSGSAAVYDRDTHITTDYQGDITGGAAEEIWELIRKIESSAVVELGEKGSVGGGSYGDRLRVTNAVTGDEYTITDGIFYSDPMLDGGPSVIVISGRFRDGSNCAYYYSQYEDGVSLFERLIDTMRAAIARDENVTTRVHNYPQPAPEVPEKLTDMKFEELEFTGEVEIYEGATCTTTKYSGRVTDEAAKKLWELLMIVEDTTPFTYDDNDSAGSYGDLLRIKNRSTGRSYTVSDGILYDHPAECGGAAVFVFDGIPFGGKNYICYSSFRFTGGSDGYSLEYEFSDLIRECVVREENVVSRETAEPQYNNSDIVLVRSYINWAWGYQLNGVLVDISGNVYKFDLSDTEVGSDEEFIQVLEKGHYNRLFGDPIGTVDDINALKNIAVFADNVDENAKITETHAAYDAGQRTLYAVNSKHELVEISSSGDFNRTNTDLNAMRIYVIGTLLTVHYNSTALGSFGGISLW